MHMGRTSSTLVRVLFSTALSSMMVLFTGLQNRNGALFFCVSIVLIAAIFAYPKRTRTGSYFILALSIFISAHLSYIFISEGIDDFKKIAIDGYINSREIWSSKIIVYLFFTLGGLLVVILARFIALTLTGLIVRLLASVSKR